MPCYRGSSVRWWPLGRCKLNIWFCEKFTVPLSSLLLRYENVSPIGLQLCVIAFLGSHFIAFCASSCLSSVSCAFCNSGASGYLRASVVYCGEVVDLVTSTGMCCTPYVINADAMMILGWRSGWCGFKFAMRAVSILPSTRCITFMFQSDTL